MTTERWDAERVAKTFDVSRESCGRLARYCALLGDWQRRINLVSDATLEDVWGRHIADSLQLTFLLGRPKRVIADLGSGAGFPGLALAIAFGHTVHLIESNGKKAAFLGEVIRHTGADAVVHNCRIAQAPHFPADAVTARALAPLDDLLELARPWMKAGAKGLFLKGAAVDVELEDATRRWKLDYNSHKSLTDSLGTALEVLRAERLEA